MPAHRMKWTGEALVPLSIEGKEALNEKMAVGWIYKIDIAEDISDKSRGHLHALLKRAWENLPEGLAEEFLHPDWLRKYALIKIGYCTSEKYVLRSKGAARAAAMNFRRKARRRDEYIICMIADNILTVYEAKSQAGDKLTRREYQDQKDKILHEVSVLVGYDITTLGRAA